MRSALALFLALSSIAAAAQSFDCKLAQSPREQAVCASPELSTLDSQVAAAYKSLRSQLSPHSAALVQSDQREWLRWLELVCPAHGKGAADDINSCLKEKYADRKAALEIEPVKSVLLYTRAHYIYVPGKPSEPSAVDIDPGFGEGNLQYPQIDQPTPEQTAFNSAVKERAAQTAVGFSQDKNATFDTAVNSNGTIDSFFTIQAINSRFIDIDLTDMTFGWGAAHPLTDRTSFLWWLDRDRPLSASDVFLPTSGWQDHLTPIVIARLEADPDLRPVLWKGDELEKSARQGALDPSHWTLTSNGLTISFGQYEVAAYVAGMPQVHFTWDELSPFLEPTLRPASLPEPSAPNQ